VTATLILLSGRQNSQQACIARSTERTSQEYFQNVPGQLVRSFADHSIPATLELSESQTCQQFMKRL
jgi:hypothetical protein